MFSAGFYYHFEEIVIGNGLVSVVFEPMSRPRDIEPQDEYHYLLHGVPPSVYASPSLISGQAETESAN
jgi:hypothetical protein